MGSFFSITSLTALAVACLFAGSARATTSSINPVADAFVDSATTPTDRSNQNFGGAGALGVSGSSSPNGQFTSVLRFDLASTKSLFDSTFGAGTWTITSASLQLTAAPANNPIFNPVTAGQVQTFWQQNDTWIEGTGTTGAPGGTGITWNSLSTFVGGSDELIGTFAFTSATSGSTSYPLTLTSSFLSDLSSGGLVSLRMSAGDPNVAVLFGAVNNQTAGNRPVLSVTAIPEPASAMVILGALASIATRRRRCGSF